MHTYHQPRGPTLAVRFSLIHDLQDINPGQWNALAQDHPLVGHEYLLAMQQAGCAIADTGWAAHYLLMHRGSDLAAAMPLYLKSHSRGEYVFDMVWARAFAQHGLAYYPKLLGAVPFTPVPGPRLLAANHADRVALAREAVEVARGNELSSLHILFPSEADCQALREAGFLFRENVQFHWFNRNYRDLDEFLAGMSQPKRKKIRQDRKKAIEAGVTFRWLQGADIDEAAMDYFYRCYCRTYMEHGNAPYLNREFFRLLHVAMAPKLLLVLAEQEGTPIAAALNILGADRLYGRYWGCTRYIPGLHFETCYIQAIEFCICRGVAVFEGGAQGEHKLSRGMLPVQTWSAHWIRDERYAAAIADFLERETPAVSNYIDELHEHSPFKKNIDDAIPGPRPAGGG
ncbi:GNAT family N-acetyltransferase [Candidimonas humi]|nr:GNAT family N-acetyltransferase [Candidimonas humi]